MFVTRLKQSEPNKALRCWTADFVTGWIYLKYASIQAIKIAHLFPKNVHSLVRSASGKKDKMTQTDHNQRSILHSPCLRGMEAGRGSSSSLLAGSAIASKRPSTSFLLTFLRRGPASTSAARWAKLTILAFVEVGVSSTNRRVERFFKLGDRRFSRC